MIENPSAAAVALDPVRAEILAALAEPGSASSVARTLDLPRQKVNYHLRLLEEHGLVEPVGERPRRGLTERLVRASARSYVVSPGALGRSGADPARTDRLSTRYLLAVAARIIAEVGLLHREATERSQRLATLTIDTEIRFASAAERSAFTAELTESITALAARYHDEQAPRGRRHRLIVAAHPLPQPPAPTDERTLS